MATEFWGRIRALFLDMFSFEMKAPPAPIKRTAEAQERLEADAW